MKNQASLLAIKVSDFIKHNSIDVSKTPMNVIVEQYFLAQLRNIDNAAVQTFDELI